MIIFYGRIVFVCVGNLVSVFVCYHNLVCIFVCIRVLGVLVEECSTH